MNKLKFNPDNAKYYSEEFIKGFECGVERQFNADMAENTAEWIWENHPIDDYVVCSKCGWVEDVPRNYCARCGAKMKGVE